MMRLVLLACTAIGLAVAGSARADDAARQPLYYQDPDGKPFYASDLKKTADGRDYRPVFEDNAGTQAASGLATPSPPTASSDHRILYYRNPMGLPDTSPKPKKDAMGMDYLPVYADEGAQGDPPGTVRISPGRLQVIAHPFRNLLDTVTAESVHGEA
jgi:membrane fusion protein, copper/silver efflux system